MAKRKLIYSIEKGGMLDDWTEELYCTKCKDGSFSLQEVQVIWDDVTKRIIRPSMPSIRGIRSLKRFAKELGNLERFECPDYESETFAEIYKKLTLLDKNFFKGLKDLMDEVEKGPKLVEFERKIKNKEYENAIDFLGFTIGPISLQEKFKRENRDSIIKSLEVNYESEKPKFFKTFSDLYNFIQNFDEKEYFKNNEITDYEKELVHTIKNAQIRLKRKR